MRNTRSISDHLSSIGRSILVGAALIFAGCDSGAVPDGVGPRNELPAASESGPEDPAVGDADDFDSPGTGCPNEMPEHFPLHSAERWEFELAGASSGGMGSGEDRSTGRVTWTAGNDTDCENGILELLVQVDQVIAREYRTFAGDDTTWKIRDTLQTRSTQTFRFSDSLSLGSYTDEPIAWEYSAQSPDTIVASQHDFKESHSFTFVRGKGLVEARHWQAHGLGGPDTSTKLTRQEN